MKINNFNSVKIKVMSFLSIIFVIYIHSPYIEALGHPFAQSVYRGMTDFGLAIFAVPLFYFMSGMLFFNGIKSWKDCLPKMHKRIYTLLIPYLIWNLIFVSWFAIMGLLPGISQFVNSNVFTQLDWNDPLASLNFLFIQPAGFHLWFLRDLILYVIISPLLYEVILRFKWGSLVILFLCLGWMPRLGLTYFLLGGIISTHYCLEQISDCLNGKISITLFIVYLLNSIAMSLGLFHNGNVLFQYYVQIMSIIAIAAIWGMYDLLIKHDEKQPFGVAEWMSYTFFIYLFHEPAFNIIKKLGLRLLGVHDWSLVLLFIINPFIMIVLAIGVGMIFKRLLPKVYAVCLGGR
ncbi:MAG: acyltransferase [Oscillospiraceae bacterium]|nr:acyltransferase [Oscillospiraceae bacterium]